MSAPAGRVLLLGDIDVDTIIPVPEYPVPGRDGLASAAHLRAGGGVVNSAVLLRRLGQPAALLACTGQDLWANSVLEPLRALGVDLDGVVQDPALTTGLTFIVVTPDGERTMFSYRGANVDFAPQHLRPASFDGAALLHIAGYALMANPQRAAAWRAVELARRWGVPVSLDTGLEPIIQAPDEFRRLLPEMDVCIVGLAEAGELFGAQTAADALESLFAAGVSLAVVKMGARGCALAGPDRQRCDIPAFRVEVVDTTGAGDAFCAGLLYGYLRGWDACLCGTLANACGALAAAVYGAGLELPGRADLLRFLRAAAPLEGCLQESVPRLLALLESEEMEVLP